MKKLISFVILLAVLCAAFGASAEEEKFYLALGDSITTGYGLKEGEKSFPQIVAEKNGYTLINRAINGNTAPGISMQLSDPEALIDILNADIITITCGGNDLMAALYQYVADVYNASVPEDQKIQPADFLSVMTDPSDPRQQMIMLAAQTALNGNEEAGVVPFIMSGKIEPALEEYLKTLSSILVSIRTFNSDVRIIVATQYNPYKFFTGDYQGMADSMEAGAQALSMAISECVTLLNCETADVYEAFSASEINLCNADMTTMNLDFHPNAKGHEVIAECVLKVIASANE